MCASSGIQTIQLFLICCLAGPNDTVDLNYNSILSFFAFPALKSPPLCFLLQHNLFHTSTNLYWGIIMPNSFVSLTVFSKKTVMLYEILFH